ncbi:MAG: glycoside hydrolase family 31 protein [Treponema sp.]|jgi:alpha-glucosidase (family GH31 glycosyl hydrolase)|nr:glycoside hydrolase family 31 protein [Treponema sp.]
MSTFEQRIRVDSRPRAPGASMVSGKCYRFTVLTGSLLRLEYAPDGVFEDRATQVVLNRDFPVPEFTVEDTGPSLVIVTPSFRLVYNTGDPLHEEPVPFTRNSLQIHVTCPGSPHGKLWHYGDRPGNLGGTTRTLDGADGEVPLEDGLLSESGYAILDDGASMILREDGWVESRRGGATDLYFFAYAHDYRRCLRDFQYLAGPAPLLPRYALGNWWSRYYRYTEESYRALMARFETGRIPFSVAVIDMDWHLVDDVPPEYGHGWTGYTWNRKFFPDPKRFLAWLHERGLKVTLNVHPADGIRAFEDAYPEMAKAMGMDPAAGEPVLFDCANPLFLKAYFQVVHHPMEDDGVDFWWIDWQQGGVTKIPGLDPLWMLNHYHYLDSARRGARPLTFSRYAGPGSHRYPVGFSGDTIITWESLDFQPRFTSSASNIAYGWWSHDIGGHMKGYRDDELTVRWVQLGVFSPVNRLHSSNNEFSSKEPWTYSQPAAGIMGEYLRLRHRLIPYLYAMNRRAAFEGEPLVQPMYYAEPERAEAYQVPNEYYFGTALVCCPITKPLDREAGAAPFRAWLPPGLWFDFFNGRSYSGGRRLTLWRPLEHMPVLAHAGAVIPMAMPEPSITEEGGAALNSTENPSALEILVFAGEDGAFHLWEDDGSAAAENWADTLLELKWHERRFTIYPAERRPGKGGGTEGTTGILPAKRRWRLEFRGFENTAVRVNGKTAQTSYNGEINSLVVEIPPSPAGERFDVRFDKTECRGNNTSDGIYRFLLRAQMDYGLKEQVTRVVEEARSPAEAIASLASLDLSEPVFGALTEMLAANPS